MGQSLEARFEKYCEAMVATMGHADREQPGRWYLKGLVLPGGRKSVEANGILSPSGTTTRSVPRQVFRLARTTSKR